MAGFKAARDFLLQHRTAYQTAYDGFEWPDGDFNCALDWFDTELAQGENADRPALRIVGEGAAELRQRRQISASARRQSCRSKQRLRACSTQQNEALIVEQALSGCVGWNSRNCRRQFLAKSGGLNCAAPRQHARSAGQTNSARVTFPS